jgi:hypothetical protein
MFCLLPHHGRIRVESVTRPDEPIPHIDDHCWNLLVWVTRRHFELCFFEKLQDIANNMTSRCSEETSSKEKLNIAETFLRCLMMENQSLFQSLVNSRVRQNVYDHPK